MPLGTPTFEVRHQRTAAALRSLDRRRGGGVRSRLTSVSAAKTTVL